MEWKLSPAPKCNFLLLGFPGSEGLAQAGEVKPAKVRREQTKPERAPLNCEQASTGRNSPVKHPTDKKRSSELITVKVVTAVVFFFFNAISMILKLSSCAYRKSKGFCINWDLGTFSLLLLTSPFQFCLSAHFSIKIWKKNNNNRIFTAVKIYPIFTGNFQWKPVWLGEGKTIYALDYFIYLSPRSYLCNLGSGHLIASISWNYSIFWFLEAMRCHSRGKSPPQTSLPPWEAAMQAGEQLKQQCYHGIHLIK